MTSHTRPSPEALTSRVVAFISMTREFFFTTDEPVRQTVALTHTEYRGDRRRLPTYSRKREAIVRRPSDTLPCLSRGIGIESWNTCFGTNRLALQASIKGWGFRHGLNGPIGPLV